MTGLFRLVSVSGDDAADFLQGQLTQDVRALPGRASLPAAWCNPQGRVVATLRLLELTDALGLVAPASLAATLVERLTMYRLRAAVELAVAGDDWQAFAVSSNEGLDALDRQGLLPEERRNAARRVGQLIAVDVGASPRLVEVYGPAPVRELEQASGHALPDREWQAALIGAGVPVIGEAASDKFTPHMLNLDCLGAISFDKGCYTGQEIVARTEYRGRSRRRLTRYRPASNEVAVGDKLLHSGREVGEVVNVVPGGSGVLAVVPIELHQQTLTVAGRTAEPLGLPYALDLHPSPLPG